MPVEFQFLASLCLEVRVACVGYFELKNADMYGFANLNAGDFLLVSVVPCDLMEEQRHPKLFYAFRFLAALGRRSCTSEERDGV